MREIVKKGGIFLVYSPFSTASRLVIENPLLRRSSIHNARECCTFSCVSIREMRGEGGTLYNGLCQQASKPVPPPHIPPPPSASPVPPSSSSSFSFPSIVCARREEEEKEHCCSSSPASCLFGGFFHLLFDRPKGGERGGGLFSGLVGGGDGERSWGILAFLFHPAVLKHASLQFFPGLCSLQVPLRKTAYRFNILYNKQYILAHIV